MKNHLRECTSCKFPAILGLHPQTAALVPKVMENISQLRALRHDSPGVADTGSDAALAMTAVQGTELSDNAAVRAWRTNQAKKK